MYSDDYTYCHSSCENVSCFRHKSHIDWSTPKHSILGASMADFSQSCPDFVIHDNSEVKNENSRESMY